MVFLKTQHWLHYLWIYAFLLKIGNDILYMSTNRELVTSMIVYCTQTASESDAFSKMSASTEKQKQNIIKKGTIYDAIIVGGGGAGCPLARTLAEVGLKVLLIERGGSRSEYPSTLDIYGIGKNLNDGQIAQLVITKEGVRSHVASVLSGGTGINVGFFIHEVEEYINSLGKSPGVTIQKALLQEALNWTTKLFAHASKAQKPVIYEDVWKEALETCNNYLSVYITHERLYGCTVVVGPFVNSSVHLHPNRTWESYSIFDSNNGGYRHAADLALGPPFREFPPTLDVLIHHTVDFIELNGTRATCVLLHKTTEEDISPIIPKQLTENITLTHMLLNHFRLFTTSDTHREPYNSAQSRNKQKTYRICVNQKGIIVSSAGAILTPLLLFKSGIGPREAVHNSGSKLIYEHPQLGQNLKDRAFLPLAIFSKNTSENTNFRSGYHQTRVGDSVALLSIPKHSKNTKDDYTASCGDDSILCGFSHIGFEILSGSHAVTGIMISTRYVVPPSLRHTLIADIFFTTLERCDSMDTLHSGIFIEPLCQLVSPIIQCLRRSFAGYVFPGNVQSKGYITVGKDGRPIIYGGYLNHSQDLEDLVNGVRLLNRIIKRLHEQKKVFEPVSRHSCPSIIFNTLIQFIELQFLDKRFAEQSSDDGLKLQDIEDAKALKTWAVQHFEESQNLLSKSVSTRKKFTSIFRSLYARPFFSLQSFFIPFKENLPATFPITAPDEKKIVEWTKSFSTSLWHWIGSAGLGKVVDSDFKLKGFDNLLIVDASVLNNFTRMNPMATIVSLSRYAGLITRQRLLNA